MFLNKLKENSKENIATHIGFKEKIVTYIKDTSLVSISAQLILFPIIAYKYKTMSFSFIITNILAGYIIGLIIIFGFILVLISFPFFKIAKIIGTAYKFLIDILLLITKIVAKLPFSKVYIKAPYIHEIVLYYILVFTSFYIYKKYGKDWIITKLKEVFFFIKSNYLKLITIILIISILFLFFTKRPKDLEIYFVDVRTR